MDYEAVGNSNIISGAFYVAVGAVLVTGGWFLLGICKQTNEWLKKKACLKTAMRRVIVTGVVAVAIILVGAGSWVVAKGGTKTTKGWNLLDNHSEKQAVLVAALRDLRLNGTLLKQCHFDAKDEDTLGEHYGYPRFQCINVITACASDKLNPNYPPDYELLRKLTVYNLVLMHMQDFLDTTEAGLYVGSGRNVVEEHKKVNTSTYVKNYMSAHLDLETTFKQEYADIWAKALKVPLEM